MIDTSVVKPLFEQFSVVWVRTVSEHSGLSATAGDPAFNIVSSAQITANLTDRCVLAATMFEKPVPGISLLFLPLPDMALVPERIVNPDSQVRPDTLTDLHRSALKELCTKIWETATANLSSVLEREFRAGETEISVDSPSNFIGTMPGLADIESFLAIQYPLEIEGGSTAMLQLFPADFILKAVPEGAAPRGAGKDSARSKMHAINAPRVTPTQVKKTWTPPAAPVSYQRKGDPAEVARRNLSTLLDVPVEVKVELGRGEMCAGDIRDLGPGSLVELNSTSSAPVGIYANGKLVARGLVVSVGDNFGVKVTELIGPEKRILEE